MYGAQPVPNRLGLFSVLAHLAPDSRIPHVHAKIDCTEAYGPLDMELLSEHHAVRLRCRRKASETL
jgi:hypothetical protein